MLHRFKRDAINLRLPHYETEGYLSTGFLFFVWERRIRMQPPRRCRTFYLCCSRYVGAGVDLSWRTRSLLGGWS